MLKLLLNKNEVLRSFIKHCIERNGAFDVSIARKASPETVKELGLNPKWNKWSSYLYKIEDIREFVKVLKENEIEYKILKQDCKYVNNIEYAIVIERT